ncbi:MAG: DUF2480 family protein [Crocinitomicaceae bacterium]|nr:DUF2480 family protein [Crocinitomicaceae bacterium]
MEKIVNKVAQSGLVTLDLETLYPKGERSGIDIAGQLWQGMALREKDFREWMKTNDWEKYRDHYVAIHCSAEAIIPQWSFMLLASTLQNIARRVVYGDLKKLEEVLFFDILSKMDVEIYREQRVIVKGCGQLPIPDSAYVELISRLQPVARSIMFGEPCSTVPVYKATKR